MAFSIVENYRTVVLFEVVFIRLLCGDSDRIVASTDTETSVGATATLNCNSFNGNIEWHHLPVDRSVHEIVYQDGFIFNGYKDRFVVTRYDRGEYNLVIKNVKTADAGKYTCVETSNVIVQKAAELIVFEQYPSVKSCAAKFTCAPLCDALELTCRMKAHGNIFPSMEWRDSANGILTSNSNIENGITTSSIHPQTNSPTAQSYSCHVIYPTYSSVKSQFNWSYSISVPASMDSSSSDEKVQPNVVDFIVVIVILSTALVAMAAVILVLFLKNKRLTFRNKAYATRFNISNSDHNTSTYIKNNVTLETKRLLEPEDEDKNIRGFFPRTPGNKNNSIHGLGILGNEVFLMTREGCVIEVFDIETASFNRAWMVDGLINPNDLAICPTKDLIVICDWKKAGESREIICCDKNGNLYRRWNSENEKGRISITTCKEANVIVAEAYFNNIIEYTCFGRLVQKFDIEREKLHLWHAVKLENENFVASFGDAKDKKQEICIIDSQGIVLHFINQDSLQQFGVSFFLPRSLAVDKKGNIYVCDLRNCNIILLTSELQYSGKIDLAKNAEALRGPLRICLYESGKKLRLLVADSVKTNGKWTEGRIHVFD